MIPTCYPEGSGLFPWYCGDELGLKMIEENMQRAWYQKFVTYDPEWSESVSLKRRPVEFDLSRFEVPLYNHYVINDDVCDVKINRRTIGSAGGDN